MSSLTEALKKLLNEKVSFPSLLKGREIHDRNDAKNTMGAAIKNLKKKKEIISQVEDLEKDWQDFLNSTEADVFFESQEYRRNVIFESLSEMNYKSRVRRGFFDQEERGESSGAGTAQSFKRVRTKPNEGEESTSSSPKSETSLIIQKNIWTIWASFLNTFLQEEADDVSMNHYSLEYLGIIQVGENIGNNQSRATYPKDLVQATNQLLKSSKQDVFSKFNSSYKEWFDSLNDSIDKCHTLLLKNSLRVKLTNDPTLTFCYEFFIIFIGQVYNSSEITEKESIYNFRVIWRFFDAIKMVTPYCKFIPGETRLQAINYELKRRGLSLSHYYNADGILIDKDFDLELVILETTGPFGLKDVPRETTDHIKAAYGLLAMLHKVAYCYEYADADIFKKLKVYFVHAAEERLRLWSFGLVQKELYIFNRVRSANLSLTHIDSKENFMDVTNLMWELKINIDNSHKILQDIKKNHEENKKAIEQGLDGHEKIKKLEELLAETAEVKLSSRVSEAEDIYVFPSDNE